MTKLQTRYYRAVLLKELVKEAITEHHHKHDDALFNEDMTQYDKWEAHNEELLYQLFIAQTEINQLKGDFTPEELKEMRREYRNNFKPSLVG